MERLKLVNDQITPNMVARTVNWGKYTDSASNYEKHKDIIEK